MDEDRKVLGRGITNSRSNYDTAAAVAKQEALIDARFTLFRRSLEAVPALHGHVDDFLGEPGAELPPRAVPRPARRPAGDERPAWLRRALRRAGAGAGAGDHGGVPAAPRGVGVPLRAGRAAQVRLLPGHRRVALPHPRRAALQGGGALLRPRAQRLRQVDHRGGEPAALGGHEREVPEGARQVHRRRRQGGGRGGGREARQGDPRDPARGDLRGGHRLRAGAPPVPQGAHPLGDPLPRPRRAPHVPGHPDRARHRRPGHQGDPGRRERHRRELPDERPLRRGLRPLPGLHRRRDEHGPARARAPWR